MKTIYCVHNYIDMTGYTSKYLKYAGINIVPITWPISDLQLVSYIKYKLSTVTYRALAIHQPPYLASLLHFSNIPRQLRSSTSQQLSIPRTKLNLGKRSLLLHPTFGMNSPVPTTFKSCESLASFRKNLQTYPFKVAFRP